MSEPRRAGPIEPGDEVGGFVIEAIAGRGGMGVVYRAHQKQPNRVVAVKVIAPDLADSPAFRARFSRESTIAAEIEHPDVIPVHAIGDDRGILFIAMRFVAGIDLRTLIAQERRLEPRRAATIIDQVAQALDAAHGRGLVHRDIKPANILLSSTGGRDHVYLTDFGLSRHIEGSQGMTGTGAFLGTIDYVAPEQARAERLDARTDVYSLGCVLFHALSGTVPFPLENDLAKLYAHGTQLPPSICERAPDVPAAFEPVLMRAMAKAPEDRYLSAGDLGRAALAAASNAVPSRAETSVAVGAAAPTSANAVPLPAVSPRPAPDTEPAQTSPPAAAAPSSPPPPPPPAESAPATAQAPAPRRPATAPQQPPPARRTRLILAGAAVIAGLAVLAVVVLSGGGGGGSSRPPAGPVAVGLVRGRSIGPVSLGETRAMVSQSLTSAGYTLTRNRPLETIFTQLPDGPIFVVGYYDGNAKVTQIQRYRDPRVTVGGVSVHSTLRQARAALPGWYEVRCPKAKRTLFAAPGGHTYFELGLNPDTPDDGGNGVDVTSSVVDRSFCG